MADYTDFLESKRLTFKPHGHEIEPDAIHSLLFPFQRDITRWAAHKGRAAVFADTGLGKTFIQLEWARLIGEPTLILAPLSVAKQTVSEAGKIDIQATYVRDMASVTQGINIANYELLEHFDASAFGAVVLDESSILKSMMSKTRKRLIEVFADTPYKLACTATPAPNDIAEIANHAEFLGVMTRAEMLAAFFVHDENGWRLKRHASDAFYRWMASWSMSVRTPSDLGYSDDGYILPKLTITPEFVKSDYKPDDQLFFTSLKGIQDRSKVRRATLDVRTDRVCELANSNTDQWIVWCGLNDEASNLANLLDGSVNVEGKMSNKAKEDAIEAFQRGQIRILITKPDIAGFGMNFQNAHRMAFMGIGDSFESYYQCIRREYRFGQECPVDVHIVLSDVEEGIYQNVLSKEAEARKMSSELIKHTQEFEKAELANLTKVDPFNALIKMKLPLWLKGS